jgi:hypothetical protein
MTPFTMRSAPAISKRPNGNLATRRRQQQPPSPTPTPSKAVPVPGATLSTGARPTLARSDPVPSHMPARPAPRRSQTAVPNEFSLPESQPLLTPPVTPTRNRTWTKSVDFGVSSRTAPLTSLPFSGLHVSPSNQPRHARTPSEGVFNLPFDEDEDVPANPSDMQALLSMLNRTPGSASFDVGLLAHENREKDGRLFASSQFQNSPSPDDLPPPCF